MGIRGALLVCVLPKGIDVALRDSSGYCLLPNAYGLSSAYSRFFFLPSFGASFSSSLNFNGAPHLGQAPPKASLTPSFSQTNFFRRSTWVISAFVVPFQ